MLIGGLVACGRTPAAPEGWVPPSTPEQLEVYQPVGGGPATELRFTGVGAPFRAAIGDAALLEPLGAALATCVSGSRSLVASYDGATHVGRLVLVLPSAGLTCPATVEDRGVDVLPLASITRALVTWRAALASTHDERLGHFDLGLHVRDGRGGVTAWLGRGADPEDVDPCVVLDGRERCGPDDLGGTLLRLPDAQPRLAELLGKR